MKRILCFIVPFLLIISAVSALDGGLYNVTQSSGALTGGAAEGGLFNASTALTENSGFYNATGNGFAANVGMFPVTGLVARPTSVSNSSNSSPPSSSSRSSGGGGGGGSLWPKNITKNEPAPVGVVESSDTRTWLNVKEDQNVSYQTAHNLSITGITLHFTELTETVKLTVKQYQGRPADAPELKDAYKYLSVEHRGLEDTDTKVVDFAVPQSWLEQLQIQPADVMLYRLESGKWVSYDATLQGFTGSTYRYTAAVPGFSYFAIGPAPGKGYVPPPTMAQDSATTQPVTEQQPPSQEQTPPPTSAPVQEQPAIITTTKAKKTGGTSIWIYGGIAVAILALGLVGAQVYQKKMHGGAAAQPVMQSSATTFQPSATATVSAGQQQAQQPKQTAPEHDPAAAVHAYIQGMRARGASDEDIKQKLLGVGWDSLVVDMELMRK